MKTLMRDDRRSHCSFARSIFRCLDKYRKVGQRVTLHYEGGSTRDAVVTEIEDLTKYNFPLEGSILLRDDTTGYDDDDRFIFHRFLTVAAENDAFPNERPISVSLKPDNPFKSAAIALGSMASLTGMKSAIVSIVTIFLLDAVDGAFSKFIDAYRPAFSPKVQRYLPLVGLWAANVLASVPINTLRFGWAYDETGESTVNPGVVAMLFLVMLAVYVRLHDDAAEDVFPLRSKVTIGIIGMSILVLSRALGILE